VIVFVSRHKNKALFAPLYTPRILDNVKLLTVRIASKANSKNAVVEGVTAAFGLVVDTIVVELEASVAGINGDRHGSLLVDGVREGRLVALGDINEAGFGRTLGPWIVMAFTLGGIVRIAVLRIETFVVDDVLESVIHHTTVASIVSVLGGTVDQVLLREINKISGF